MTTSSEPGRASDGRAPDDPGSCKASWRLSRRRTARQAGNRFGISRTHVRKLLVEADETGLVKLHARGGRRVEILPRMWAVHDRAMSWGMYLHDMIYVAATRAHERS